MDSSLPKIDRASPITDDPSLLEIVIFIILPFVVLFVVIVWHLWAYLNDYI